MEQEHKRRPRYKGTHPRTFQEKYKEHDPENYRSDVEKIIESGKTPAGMHIPILVDEILEVLQIQPGQTGYDATLGYGGHTRRMLAQLQGQGHLYATDVDPIEMEKTRARLASAGFGPELLTIQHRNFADVDQVAPGVLFDFVLADLGVSSMQIDDPTRGFTFKQDGPLDLRLDPSSGVTAAERLRQLDQEELENLLVENSDEPYADRIAKAVIQVFRRGGTVDTTRQLYALIEGALSFLPAGERKEAVKKSCQRTFQALRIDVNSEFEVLYAFLEKLPHVLKPGGHPHLPLRRGPAGEAGLPPAVPGWAVQRHRPGGHPPLSPGVPPEPPGPLHQAALGCPGGVNADFMEKELTSMLRDETIRRVIQFRDDREWRQFHTPKDLAISLSLEAAELLEIFQWSGADLECRDKLGRIREELADVLSYCVLMADVCGLDLDEILNAKVDQNAAKYPVEKARGSAAKYTELT